ncbi:hypothetical protein [Streptomyces sp. NPDC058086]|uniref:hypothetical protein n=1 Tax=Streptomyces sp. NPDC058086 TaxID=3346334 RepID=UPI0036EC5709
MVKVECALEEAAVDVGPRQLAKGECLRGPPRSSLRTVITADLMTAIGCTYSSSSVEDVGLALAML